MPNPGKRVLEALVALADEDLPISELSRKLFLGLRKLIGSPDLESTLLGLQFLAYKGDVSGARLLAAYLDVTTAGARLVPFVRDFKSSRRHQLFLNNIIGQLDGSARDWQSRALRLSGICRGFPLEEQSSEPQDPWVRMRAVLGALLGGVITGDGISSSNRVLLADLLRLETDAWEERIGRLAGMVNPFRVSAVQRVLPILGQADMSIKDLRQLIVWVEDGQDHRAFTRQGFRALEVLDEIEFGAIYSVLKNEMKLQVMARMHIGGRDNPLPLSRLGMGAARLMALDHRLVAGGFKEENLDLLSAVALVQQYARGNNLALPLDQNMELLLEEILASSGVPSTESIGRIGWSLEGFSVESCQLLLEIGNQNGDPQVWPHGLPTPYDIDPSKPLASIEEGKTQDNPDESKVDLDASAIKHLVMSNIMSTSVVLGFLRNPKVVSIPGLVAAVAERTRNPQIIATIASDRTLFSGFANRDVPLVCLRSPCNVSPKTLRKFIHVKFVSKIDLKRMTTDRTGIRKEIAREINKYLDALS